MEGRKGSERAPMVVGHGELQLLRGPDGGGNKNAASTLTLRLNSEVDELKETMMELWLEWHWLWCSGELTRARRSKWRRRWLSQRLRRAWAEQMEQGLSRGERGVHLRPNSEHPGWMEASV